MTLYEWTTNALSTIELFQDVIEVTSKNGIKLTRNVEKERNLAIGLINSDDSLEFYNIAKQVCPVGTIIEEYDENKWTELYEDKLKLAKIALTKELLNERFAKSANTLIKILEKRDRNHWSDNSKQISIDTKDTDKSININIVSV